MNKNNILFFLSDYLKEKNTNKFLTNYFIKNLIENDTLEHPQGRIILFVDKLNSKPTFMGSIVKCANSNEYTPRLRKINFKNITLEQNDSKIFYNALKSKTLYNFIDLLKQNFYTYKIVEYKKIDNEYYKSEMQSKNIYEAINSFNSDYVFVIFTK